MSAANGQVPFVQNATPGISNRAWTPESQLLLAGQSTPEQFVTNVQNEYESELKQMSTGSGHGLARRRINNWPTRPPPKGPRARLGAEVRAQAGLVAAGCSLLPALVMYAVFVLYPILTSIQYSFYDWDGIGRGQVGRPRQLQDGVHRPAVARPRSGTRSS